MSTSRTFHLTVLAVAAIVGTTACGSGSPNPSASPRATSSGATPAATAAAAAAPANWPGFRGSASRTGIGDAGPAGHPVLNWRFQAKAAVPHNVSIVGDQVSFASDDGTVYALDRSTGAQRWAVAVGSAPLIGPVADDGRLYFVNGAGAAIALDAATGTTLWTSSTTYDGPSDLVSDGRSIYFGTHDGNLVAVDAASGAERWKVKPSPTTTTVDNPAVADGIVYAGTDGGGFVAVDAATHQVVWAGDTSGEDTGTASVNGGLAFIATGADAPAGHLRAFDSAAGQPRWTAAEPLLTLPVAANGLVFSSTNNGLVQALDLQSGAVRWSIQISGKIRPLAVAGTTLYIAADSEKRVYAVEAATGGKLWQFDVDDSNDCCIAVTGGAVYVATMAGSVYSIGGDGATIASEPFPSAAPTATPPASGPGPVATLEVTVAWSAALDANAIAPICQIALDPQGRIWAPQAEADTIAVYTADGTFVETWGGPGSGPGQFDLTRSNGDGYGSLAFAKDGSFFVLDVGNRRVQHFDAHRRFVGQWGSFGTGPGQFSDPVGIAVARDGTVWVIDDQRSVLEHYRPDGTVLGSFDPFVNAPHNDGSNGLAIDRDGNLYVSQIQPNQIAEFDDTGSLLRTFDGPAVFPAQPTQMAIDGSGRLFVTQGPDRGSLFGVTVFGSDGAVLGGFGPEGTGDGRLLFPAGIAIDGRGGLIVEDSLPESARLIRYRLPADLR